MKPWAILFAFLAFPAGAATLVSPGEFESLSTGRTLHFDRAGQPFGAEQYLSGRRTIWRFADSGLCMEGSWQAEGDLVCFRYRDGGGPECWHFLREGAGLEAALVENDAETGFALELSHSDDQPLDCPGPDVGS